MNRIKLIFAILLASISFGLFSNVAIADKAVDFNPSGVPVNQIGGCEGAAKDSAVCTDLKSTGNPLFGPDGILTKVAGIFALLTGVISVFMVIISGLRYVTSSGDGAKTKTAKDGIMYSAIGIAVSLVAGSIVRFVLSKL